MIPRIDMVVLDGDADALASLPAVIEEGHSRIPVYRGGVDRIIGILYSKDLLRLVEDGRFTGGGRTLAELVRPAYFVPESKKIDEVLDEFRSKRIHMAVVIDEYGGTAGLVTLEDVIEEIVGEIEDEFDEEEELVAWLDDRRVRAGPEDRPGRPGGDPRRAPGPGGGGRDQRDPGRTHLRGRGQRARPGRPRGCGFVPRDGGEGGGSAAGARAAGERRAAAGARPAARRLNGARGARERTVLDFLRKHFLTGLLSVSPLAFTAWVLWRFYEFVSATMRPWLQRLPALSEAYPDFFLNVAGFVIFFLLIVFIGLLTRSLLGVAVLRLVERVVERIPVVKSMYSGTKQIAAVFLGDRRTAFQRVVLFEYPRRGIFSMGLVTRDDPGDPLVNVFLPTTPNPTSGFLLLVPRGDLREAPVGVEEAIKIIVSGGSVMTAGQAARIAADAGILAAAPTGALPAGDPKEGGRD